MSKDIIADLKRDEGRNVIDGKHMPYKCSAGKLTIGYGRNLDDNGISEEEAIELLREDMYSASTEVEKLYYFDNTTKGVNIVRHNVLVNMIFNLGITRYKKFKKHIAAVKVQDWEEAANQMMDSSWYKQVGSRQVGSRAKRLVEEMRTGE